MKWRRSTIYPNNWERRRNSKKETALSRQLHSPQFHLYRLHHNNIQLALLSIYYRARLLESTWKWFLPQTHAANAKRIEPHQWSSQSAAQHGKSTGNRSLMKESFRSGCMASSNSWLSELRETADDTDTSSYCCALLDFLVFHLHFFFSIL